MKRILSACLAVCLASCAPSAIIRTTHAPIASKPADKVLVLQEQEVLTIPAEELGDIHIRDGGLALICDYETVVKLASDKARQMGANVLKIYEHRLPGVWSTCHQIRGKALRVADVTPLEKEILWQPSRHLRVADFKGSPEKRPFQASTNSSIRYRYEGMGFGKMHLTIESFFDCQNSYFKPSEQSEYTLAHEQLHFDITELHARRFAKLLHEQVTNSRDLERKHEALFTQIMSACTTMQDAYDSEVYADRSQLPRWQQQIAAELAALDTYADKSMTLKMSF